jgi:hypothetical protein
MRRLVFLLVVAACDDGGVPDLSDATSATATPTASAPKKPGRNYYLANEESKCRVYWIEDGMRSVDRFRACPREVEPGEKIRLTGRTCIRESATESRNMPVRCPRELYKAKEADQDGKGPDLIPTASAKRED